MGIRRAVQLLRPAVRAACIVLELPYVQPAAQARVGCCQRTATHGCMACAHPMQFNTAGLFSAASRCWGWVWPNPLARC